VHPEVRLAAGKKLDYKSAANFLEFVFLAFLASIFEAEIIDISEALIRENKK